MSPQVLLIYTEPQRAKPYQEALAKCGAHVLLEPARDGFTPGGFDGLLLMGGIDVDPRLYGESAHAETDQPDPVRDRAETAALLSALRRGVPVLAICRGLQLLNVHLGGTLQQHLPPSAGHAQPGVDHAHDVGVASRSLLHRVTEREAIAVNSRHHQAVDRLATGLAVTARSPDNIVEAVELTGAPFVLGVQWHPEDLVSEEPHRRLFESFVAACASPSR